MYEPPPCPRCTRAMVLRTSQSGAHAGTQFFGCSDYPRCRGTKALIEPAGPNASLEPGNAGESAQLEYERRVARRKQRVRGRFGRRLGGMLLTLTEEPQSTRAWARGAEGERELAKAMEGLDGIELLHDRRVPGSRGNIDHIVVAPAGIFVIDAKLYTGLIKVRDVGSLFRRDERLYVGRRDCSRLAANMAWQLEAVRTAAAATEPTVPISAVLCFAKGEWPLLGAPTTYAGVRLEGTRSLRKAVQGGSVLGAEQVTHIARALAMALPAKSG